MVKRVKKLWLKALRSGKYKQAKCTLRKENSDGKTSFCCLGVLCDLYIHEKHKDPQWVPGGAGGFQIRGTTKTTILPRCVQKWAGIDHHGSFDMRCLSEENDHCGSSFKKIANIIEEEF